MTSILEIRNLSVGYVGRHLIADAVTEVDLDVESAEIFGLVGESGCGKSTLAVAVLGLIEAPGKVLSGSVKLSLKDGTVEDLAEAGEEQLRKIRWNEIAYIPQGSMNALNPVLRVHRQMTDTLVEHGLNTSDATERARWALQLVSLEPSVLDRFPHELSGGMKQRVAIATAVTLQPGILIADEPTTALDVVTQRSILQELVQIRADFGTSIMLISHDMAVMAEIADRIAVMYAGCVAEVGRVQDIFAAPMHPYTQRLIGSIPKRTGERLEGLVGESPNIWRQPEGCRFHTRCPRAMQICTEVAPKLQMQPSKHQVSCHLYSG
jgi:peptide/nickel transport system ATP-binding protein